jgi:hypothetical protein
MRDLRRQQHHQNQPANPNATDARTARRHCRPALANATQSSPSRSPGRASRRSVRPAID